MRINVPDEKIVVNPNGVDTKLFGRVPEARPCVTNWEYRRKS